MDNRYWMYGCPALMQDGRAVSNYTRPSIFDQFIRNANGIISHNEYRMFLQKYGNDIINKERALNEKQYLCKVGGTCAAIPMEKANLIPYSNCNAKYVGL